MRGKGLLASIPLGDWMVVCTNRTSMQAKDLVKTLMQVGGPMGMEIRTPQL